MFGIKQQLYRVLASCVIYLRRAAILRAAPKFVVVTGSVGKTIMRRALIHVYEDRGEAVYSLPTDYVNEFGIVLSLVGLETFHGWRLDHWWRLWTKSIYTGYIIVEIGADFRTDITWFLRYFRPDLVVFTYGTACPWTPCVEEVLASRLLLAEQTYQRPGVYVASYDITHRELLESGDVPHVVVDAVPGPYDFPRALTSCLGVHTDASIVNDRFMIQTIERNTLLTDTYKVTPLCLDYMLDEAIQNKASKRILVLSEIRPNVARIDIYDSFIKKLSQFDKVLFVGDSEVYAYLTSRLRNISSLTPVAAEKLISMLDKDSEVLAAIKISRYYKRYPAMALLVRHYDL